MYVQSCEIVIVLLLWDFLQNYQFYYIHFIPNQRIFWCTLILLVFYTNILTKLQNNNNENGTTRLNCMRCPIKHHSSTMLYAKRIQRNKRRI